MARITDGGVKKKVGSYRAGPMDNPKSITKKAPASPTKIRDRDKPQFVPANGSSVRPTTAQDGQSGAFGAMLPTRPRFDTEGVGINSERTGFFDRVKDYLISSGIAKTTLTVPVSPITKQNNFTGVPYSGTLAALTGGKDAAGVNQYNYLTPQQKLAWDERKRREQITALTAPYQGTLAAITGANMVEPSNLGFPGTDPRQPVRVSNQYLQGGATALPQVGANPVVSSYGGYGGAGSSYRRRGGGGGGGGNGGTTGGYTYGNSVAAQVLNWRVATG